MGLSIAGVSLTAASRLDWLGWVALLEDERQGRIAPGMPLTTDMQRVRQLESENRQLGLDKDLLKKPRTSMALSA